MDEKTYSYTEKAEGKVAGDTVNLTAAKAKGLLASGAIVPYGDFRPQPVEADEDGGDLRDDGPTVEEFVSAGYKAIAYPPEGYASRSTEEAIAAAIDAERQADQQADDDKKAKAAADKAAKKAAADAAKNGGGNA